MGFFGQEYIDDFSSMQRAGEDGGKLQKKKSLRERAPPSNAANEHPLIPQVL
jgi:hypothetical protein